MAHPKRKDYTEAEARRRFGEIVERASSGEVLTISRRGRVVATLLPPPDAARPRLGGLRGTARLLDDLIAPVDTEWEAG